MEEERPALPPAGLTVGADISTLSVDEIAEHIAQLRAEIARLEAALAAKQASRAAADAAFKF